MIKSVLASSIYTLLSRNALERREKKEIGKKKVISKNDNSEGWERKGGDKEGDIGGLGEVGEKRG